MEPIDPLEPTRRSHVGADVVVEVVPVPTQPGCEAVVVSAADARVAIGWLWSNGDGSWLRIETAGRIRGSAPRRAWSQVARLIEGNRPAVNNVVAWDGLVRQVLRRSGFGGPVAGVLVRGGPYSFPCDPAEDGSELGGDGPAAAPTVDPAARLAEWVSGLSGLDVRAARRGGLATRLSRWAVWGMDGIQPFEVVGVSGGRNPLRLALPLRPDLLVEEAAVAVQDLARLAERFPGQIPPVSFDLSSRGMVRGRVGGQYGHGAISVNARYVLGDVGFEEHGTYPRPFVDGLTLSVVLAHEVWHAVEAVRKAKAPRVMSDLDRAMGEALGVPSLARAFLRQTEADLAALARLEQELGPYAATNPEEATAELFCAGWAGPRPPVLSQIFGALVDEYLPAAP